MRTLSIIALLLVTITTSAQQQRKTHVLEVYQSIIHWKGSYTFQMSEHVGTAYFSSGSIDTEGDKITGGNLVIDMKSITNPDYAERGHGPVGHLKNEDFFHVEKYPEAQVTFTNVTYYPDTNTHEILADMTIKGVTKSIKTYATVDGDKKTLKTKFKINRTRWGINYNNSIKDEFISDAIEFDVLLQF